LPYTFGQLKTDLRLQIWPNGEAENLRPSHDQSFIDALMDLQQWVDCQQQDNTQLVPQCATTYNCGVTAFDAPRGFIKGLSVIDKVNPDTGLEDATAADDYCSEIKYCEIDYCHFSAYVRTSNKHGCCLPFFFGVTKHCYPTPTDEGLPAGLAPMPLGYHYPQESTDSAIGRATSGVWAKNRGHIYVFPWLQSTETIILLWDGLKRSWVDGDFVDDDPMFKKAVRLYVQNQHAGEWDKERDDEASFGGKYNQTRAELIRICREETRVRECCESSNARGSQVLASLFYNDAQTATAHCQDGQTGDAVTVTIPAGTVASMTSKADANQLAHAQALTQATAQLDCVTTPVVYTNTAQTAVASCTATEGAPPPDGAPVTRTVPAGQVSSSVSQAAADAQALALAQSQADAALTCTFWNSEQSYTATCTGVGSDVTKTTPAHTFSSTVSQADADAKALNDAKSDAEAELPSVCTETTVYSSTPQIVSVTQLCSRGGQPLCNVFVTCQVAAGTCTSLVSQADANQQAQNAGRAFAQQRALQLCATSGCGSYNVVFP
jgi:hypothetical protein